MKRVSVTELKNKLSHYLRLVKQGETVEILEHTVPVAQLSGLPRKEGGGEAHLERLVRDGIVTVARNKPAVDLLKKPPVRCKGDAVEALVEQRGER